MATLYGGMWLEPTERWVQFGPQTPLGVFVAAERCFRAWVVGVQRFQVQLVPRRIGEARQWQLLRAELQTAGMKFWVDFCYMREIALRV